MSLSALGVIAVHIARFGTAAQPDEGTAAHLWQLLMVAQLPVIGLFLFKWTPRAPRIALLILAVQIIGAFAAFAPVYILKW